MKRMNTLLMILALAGGLISCGPNQKQDSSQKEATYSSEIDQEVSNAQVQHILTGYLKLKDALVATDGTTAKAAAEELFTMLEDNEAEVIQRLRADVDVIKNSEDAHAQRNNFHTLSDNLYELIKSTDANDIPIYRQFCPMARNNEGAYWLSAEKEVLNPYFGDVMLHCGSVKESF